MKRQLLKCFIGIVLIAAAPLSALAQNFEKPVNKLPKCLKKETLPSGGEYYIKPLKNFSYDIELNYKIATKDLPFNVKFRKGVQNGQPSSIIDVFISRANPPKGENSKLIYVYDSVQFEDKTFNGWFSNSSKPMPLNLIAKAVHDGKKIQIKDNAKVYELQIDATKIKNDWAAIGPNFIKIISDEGKKLCRNEYDFLD